MKKKALTIFVFLALAVQVRAQDPLRDKLNLVFANINKSQIPTGFLEEYATPLVPLDVFNGVLTDSNRVQTPDVWRMIYTTLYSSRIYGTNPLPTLTVVNTAFTNAESANTAIPVPLLYADYNYIRPDAVSANLLRITNDQLYDVAGRTQSPYYGRSLFASVPLKIKSTTGSVSFIFKPELFYKVSAKTLQYIYVDFEDGRGYINVLWNTPVNASYSTIGIRRIKIKITFTDGTKAECYSDVNVSEVSVANRFATPEDFIQPFPSNGNHSGGNVYVKYSSRGTERQITKPLIVAEGYDAHRIAPDLNENYSFARFINSISNQPSPYDFNRQLDNLAGYDLIFLDYTDGTDDIKRNAALFKEVIAWVNTQKAAAGSTEQNVVMGLSMGGLVTRYALADMTKQGLNPQTRLLITHDSPHRGANTPLGFQFLTRLMATVRLFSSISPTSNIVAKDIWEQVHQADKLLDEPATKHLLVVRAKDDHGNYEYNSFLDNEYRNMITFSSSGPQPTYRFIATSLGSECGTGSLAPQTEILRVNASYMFDLMQYVARHKVRCEIIVNALPAQGQSKRITYLKVWFEYKILTFININVPLINFSANSPSNALFWDGAPGGTQNARQQAGDSFPSINWMWGVFELTFIPQFAGDFCFVPTASALDISNITGSALTSSYSGGISPVNQARAANFIAQEAVSTTQFNQTHIRFTPRNAEWLFNEMEPTQGIANTLNCSATCPINFANTLVLGPNTVCISNATFTVPAASNFNVNWTIDTNLMSYVSGQGTNNFITKQKSLNGYGFVRADFTDPCGTPQQVQNTVRVGGYGSGDFPISGPTSACKNTLVGYSTNTLLGATNYVWGWGPDWTLSSGQGTPGLVVRTGNSGAVVVKVANACSDGGSPAILYTTTFTCGYAATYSPNPADSQLTIQSIDESENESTINVEEKESKKQNKKVFAVRLFDSSNQLKRTGNTESGTLTLDVKDLPEGKYILHIETSDNLFTEQIVISR
jgi:hypothetical protein